MNLLVMQVGASLSTRIGFLFSNRDVLLNFLPSELASVNFPNLLSQHQRSHIPVLLITASELDFANTWLLFIKNFRRSFPQVFILCVHTRESDAMNDARIRLDLFAQGANMLSFDPQAIDLALKRLRAQRPGEFPCVFCDMKLDEDSLWEHTPLYHENEASPAEQACPICQMICLDPFAVHLRNAHGPCARGEVISEYSMRAEKIYAFALVVCVRERNNVLEMLLVHEFASLGYWLPAGRVNARESMQEAAHRECEEETGVRIDLRGVLQVQYSPSLHGAVRLRVVFYATQRGQALPKTVPDFESCGASWASFAQIRDMHARRELRGPGPVKWADYLEEGGEIHPLSVLGEED